MGETHGRESNKDMKKKIILDLCGGTGAWSEPYRKAGYDVRVITLPEHNILFTRINNNGTLDFYRDKMHVSKDFQVKIKDIHGILAAPPCTQFSFARTTAKTPRDFKGAMEIISACEQIIRACVIGGGLKFWAMENPTGHLRRFIGKPTFRFYQWQFGGYHVKSTDIWGHFNYPRPTVKIKPEVDHAEIDRRWANPVIPEYIKERLKSTGERRAAVRAITPEGFARAFYKSNK